MSILNSLLRRVCYYSTVQVPILHFLIQEWTSNFNKLLLLEWMKDAMRCQRGTCSLNLYKTMFATWYGALCWDHKVFKNYRHLLDRYERHTSQSTIRVQHCIILHFEKIKKHFVYVHLYSNMHGCSPNAVLSTIIGSQQTQSVCVCAKRYSR